MCKVQNNGNERSPEGYHRKHDEKGIYLFTTIPKVTRYHHADGKQQGETGKQVILNNHRARPASKQAFLQGQAHVGSIGESGSEHQRTTGFTITTTSPAYQPGYQQADNDTGGCSG